MSEIVVVAESSAGRSRASQRPLPRSTTAGYVPRPFDSESIPSSLVADIRQFLRVANQIEIESPRAAYLCRVHAFEKVHEMDPKSSGRGVRQFKTSLLQRLEQDEEVTNFNLEGISDTRELKRLLQKYAEIGAHVGTESTSRERLTRVYKICSVLKAVLNGVSGAGSKLPTPGGGKPELFAPYNILPLDPGGAQQTIMQLPEIEAAVEAVRNIRGLPLPENHPKQKEFMDILDWLQFWFGFQKGNVDNQREHLILLLANIHVRQTPKPRLLSKLDERAVNELTKKLFKNYKHWCKFLRRKDNLEFGDSASRRKENLGTQNIQQYKILYTGLYLLIWGEASNLRFMPECLCYIFHHMAHELYGLVSLALSAPVYGGGSESFLKNVVTPIYRVIYEEAQKNKSGMADHSQWRNYDDLNEFFWSPNCFQIGWPLRLQHAFFRTVPPKKQCNSTVKTEVPDKADGDRKAEEDHGIKWLGKTNFVEIRSFWHLFRSFDRMWTFFILILQVMVIMAWHGLGSIFQFVNVTIFEDIVSIFITSALLRLIQAIFDFVFIWKARKSMPFSQILRYVMKIIAAVIWTISLPITYVDSKRNISCSTRQFRSGFGEWCFSSYMIAITIYLFSNAVGMVLFFVPALSSHIETSNWRICSLLSWWAQPQLYVGRGMQERLVSAVKYTLFWGLLLLSKFSFSYHFEIKPLVEPTKQIMKIGVSKYEWHELFPKVKNNAGAIVAIWAPIILVYFMDTQIWYSVFCTIIGGVYGVFHHMGEIHSMGMLRSRFHTLPSAFNVRLIPPLARKEHKTNIRSFLQKKFRRTSVIEKNGAARFTQVWNQIITTFRSEDLINNREMDLLTIPFSSELSTGRIQWPAFLLAAKLSAAVDMVKEFSGKDDHLYKRIRKDSRMHSAMVECYEALKNILELLVVRELEKRVISEIISEVETSISRSIFLSNFEMSKLSVLCDKCAALVQLLIKNETSHQDKVVRLLQDIFELITRDMMRDATRIFDLILQLQPTKDSTILFATPEPELFGSLGGNKAIRFPLRNTIQLKQKMKRLHLLLTAKESALDIPKNLEARRRISFFATSLFMDMPTAPRVQDMLSFSVMTPYFTEEVVFSKKELDSTQSWVPIIVYMETIYPDEWRNFLERMGCENLDNAINELQNWESYRGQSLSRTDEWKKCLERMGRKNLDEFIYKLEDWASCRGQTLSRTVRGMMYYRKALKLQAFLDMAENENLLESYKGAEREHDKKNNQHPLSSKLDALADVKFTYVISCQMFAKQKASGDQCAADILKLMIKYPSLRVAYIEEKEDFTVDKTRKEYSSVLIKAVDRLEQEIYRVKLPGPPIIGEGKPENQNHAIIFTRGDVLQTIDMNQDNYMEEAFKMRNILQEFVKHGGERPPTILGLREHIFTGSVSSLAGFMSYQETSFVTIGQRLLADPLRVRFHYGHPDLFDRVFHLTRGGISKASKTINLSEDVFAGFNSTLRQGHIAYREYMQVGKGRDVGLNQITKFEAKVANGNSEQTLSRDIYRLGRCFDFFRMLSCYFTTLGFYSNTLISMIGIYVFLYGQLYLTLSGLERTILNVAGTHNIKSLETALASQSFIQLGLLTGLPMLMEIGLEKGFRTAFNDFILMQMQLSAVFFTFSLGTKFHYYGRTMLHGGAKYRPTGRKFVVFHASFTENYRLYSRSHFVKGFELMFLLIIYHSFRHHNGIMSVLATFSIWFMVGTWLFAPFLFNPSGFEWHKVVEDWKDWNKWIKHQGGIGIQPDKSWESWWNEEQIHLRHSGWGGRIAEVLLSIRFFIYQYGLVYHLDISQENKTVMVYILSWVVIGSILLFVKALELGREILSAEFHLVFRLFKAVLFLGAFSILVTLFAVCKLSMADLFVCSLAFLPTGWGLLLIAQALRPMVEKYGSWDSVRVLSKAYDGGMGLLLFVPLAVLSWLPFMPDFQTRLLFNPAFNKHLHVEMILGRKHRQI